MGLQTGAAIRGSSRLRKKEEDELRQAALQKRQKDIADSITQGRERTLESIKQQRELAVKIIENGGDPEDEGFKKYVNSIQANATAYAKALSEMRGWAEDAQAPAEVIASIEDPRAFVENQMIETQAAIDAAKAARSNTAKIVKPDELAAAGFPQEVIDAGIVVQQKPDGVMSVVFEPPDATADATEQEKAIDARVRVLVKGGMPENAARLVAGGGVEVVIDPTTKEMSLVNKGTGQTLFTTRGEPGEMVDVPPVVPPGTIAEEATGLSGAAKNLSNIVADAVGANIPFKENQQATDALQQIQTTTKLALQVAIPGRPAKDIRDDLEKITVTPNSITQGDQRALSKFKQMKRFIDNNIATKQNALSAGDLAPDVVKLLTDNIRELETMQESYDDIINSFGAGDLKTKASQYGQELVKQGKLEELRALNDALESGDPEAIRKAMGKANGGD